MTSTIARWRGWKWPLLLMSLVLGVGLLANCRQFLPAAEQESPSVVAQGGDATVSIYPDRGPGGTYIQVAGHNWPGERAIVVMVADEHGYSEPLTESTTAADGELSTGFLYPFDERWLAPGTYSIVAETEAGDYQASTPFHVATTVETPAETPVTVTATATTVSTPTPTMTATATATEPPPTPTSTATSAATATPTLPPTATPTSLPAPTATPLPPTPTVHPTAPAVASPNLPPHVDAALMPLQDDVHAHKGRFQIQVAATDPEGDLQELLIVLKVPAPAHEREPKLKADKSMKLRYKDEQWTIEAPDPQLVLAQLESHGGILLENGAVLDLQIKDQDKEELTLREDGWRLKVSSVVIEVLARDGNGLQTVVRLSPCSNNDCPQAAADDDRNNGDDEDDNDGNDEDEDDDDD